MRDVRWQHWAGFARFFSDERVLIEFENAPFCSSDYRWGCVFDEISVYSYFWLGLVWLFDMCLRVGVLFDFF